MAAKKGKRPNTTFPLLTFEAIANVRYFAPAFVFISLSISQAITATQVAREREHGHRRSLQILGMKTSAYWTSTLLVLFVTCLVTSLSTIGFGLLFDITLIKETDFEILMITFSLYSLVSCGVAYLFGALIPTSRTAGLLSFVYILAFYLIGSMATYFFVDGVAVWLTTLLSCFPAVLLMRACSLLSDAATMSSLGVPGASITLDNVWDHTDIMPVGGTWKWMAGVFVGFVILATYIDTVAQSGKNYLLMRRKPRQHKTPPSTAAHDSVLEAQRQTQAAMELVAAEAHRTKGKHSDAQPEGAVPDGSSLPPVIVNRLSMEFMRFPSMKRFPAVDDVSFSVPNGAIFALLGPNGAGKTTTLNCIIGNYTPTHGSTLVLGKPIHEVRDRVGLVPQFDVVWDKLTAREHVQLFARIKGVAEDGVDALEAQILDDMALTHVTNALVGTFSGGMRRRLSIGLSLIGEPNVVFLDEPTTGVDPKNRRVVWEALKRYSKNKTLILTTHSMEEADTLGDIIAIVGAGKMQTVGPSLALKAEFGSGYAIRLSVEAGTDVNTLVTAFQAVCPRATLTDLYTDRDSGRISATIRLAREETELLPAVLDLLETRSGELGILDYFVTLDTLEDVFLRIADAVTRDVDGKCIFKQDASGNYTMSSKALLGKGVSDE
ncbi:ABC transporter A, ABCA [Kipferlia bialata]|uniref:ABC transporter A, ABCA n=1 Tax=Kipferlia bialata TaxID=797122 RepID=A0A9K3CPU3_9EUKA|nr:ABC transporter A, ABCA [Kipferlia bialata]|eukprot:g1111.t1